MVMKSRIIEGLKYFGSLFLNVFFFFIFVMVRSMKCIIFSRKLLVKLIVLTGYALLVWSYLYHPMLFGIIVGIILLVAFFFAVMMIKCGGGSKEGDTYSSTGSRIPFFEGMTVEMAKKEYRRLMKEYHPDNGGGNLEMAQEISAAYRQFQMKNAR